MRLNGLLLAALLLSPFRAAYQAPDFSGRVIGIVDGDTIGEVGEVCRLEELLSDPGRLGETLP